ncbi:hypothetical protein ACJRO7_027088 [Eucalyptus globulus]|uniref:Uncharacterized protein n=1 Tax=Eucalyptus globulus TaxID=34317 RepID=A0ABD3JQV9_EUCGL
MSPRQVVLALLLLISLELTHATRDQIDDHSYKVPGENKYADELNIGDLSGVLIGATQAISSAFNQTEDEDMKYNGVSILADSFNDPLTVARTKGNLIRLNVDYLQHYRGDIQEEFAGVMYHEMTRVMQWTGNGTAPRGLINGIADYVRLKGGHESKSWPKKGSGSRWDDGFAIAPGFVANLNALMKYSYSEAFFVQLLGKSVHQLWGDYKLAYATRRIPGTEEGYRKPPTRCFDSPSSFYQLMITRSHRNIHRRSWSGYK